MIKCFWSTVWKLGSHTTSSGIFPWGWALSTHLARDTRRSTLVGGGWAGILALPLCDIWKSLHFSEFQFPSQLMHSKQVLPWKEMMTCESLAQCQEIVVLAMVFSSSLSLPYSAGIRGCCFFFSFASIAERYKKHIYLNWSLGRWAFPLWDVQSPWSHSSLKENEACFDLTRTISDTYFWKWTPTSDFDFQLNHKTAVNHWLIWCLRLTFCW